MTFPPHHQRIVEPNIATALVLLNLLAPDGCLSTVGDNPSLTAFTTKTSRGCVAEATRLRAPSDGSSSDRAPET